MRGSLLEFHMVVIIVFAFAFVFILFVIDGQGHIVDEESASQTTEVWRIVGIGREPEQERLNRNAEWMDGRLEVTIELLPARTDVDPEAVDEVDHNVIARAMLKGYFQTGRVPIAVGQARGNDNRSAKVPTAVDFDSAHLYKICSFRESRIPAPICDTDSLTSAGLRSQPGQVRSPNVRLFAI